MKRTTTKKETQYFINIKLKYIGEQSNKINILGNLVNTKQSNIVF